MKKLLAACVCAGLSFSFAGCSPETILEQFTSTGDTSVRELTSSSDTTTETETKDRIYMDELSGTLQDFSGSQLILNTDSASYVFNVSNATLECKGGMITGDEISIIYEGQLSGTDTGSVHVLKVVDEFHKKNKLKKRTAHGQVISLTSNTITIKSKKGKTATYPITGTKQYYQNGIKAGDWVYLTFKGKFPDTSNDSSASLNASHLKVLSISDLKDLEIPDPTPTPDPKLTQTPEQIENKEKQVLDIFYNLLGGLKYVVGLIVAIHLFTRYLCDNNYMNEIQKMHKLINEMSMGEFINYLGVKEMSLDDIGDPVVKFMKDVYVTSKNNVKCL